jgi:uncharacterized integral membrane protein
MRRFVILFVLLPLAILVVTLSVANRTPVTFSLDPVHAMPWLSITAPFFFFLFAALGLGIIFGGVAAWFGQAKWRRAARAERANAARLRTEAESLRERLASLPTPLPGPRQDAA